MTRKIVKNVREFYIEEGLSSDDLDKEIRMADIQYHIASAGPRSRIEVFFQGCSHMCKGCINYHLWSYTGGRRFKAYEVLGMIDPIIDPGFHSERGRFDLSIGGGEPFAQIDGLLALLRMVSQLANRGDKHIIVYSGYTLGELTSGSFASNDKVKEILKLANVLVDGKFVEKQVCLKTTTSFIGSANQNYIILDKRGKPRKIVDAVTANSFQGDINKEHLSELEE